MKKCYLILILLFSGFATISQAQISLLHSFEGGAGDGENPYGSLIQNGSTLYGMTSYGGSSDMGTVFKVGIDGIGFAVLHTFMGGVGDGENPYGSLIQNGSTLYGMTQLGGSSDFGTIFSIETNGTGFAVLHNFVGGDGDGQEPYGSLIQDGSTLYGMTYDGGSVNWGTVFKVETNGSGFAVLHSFTANDGAYPTGSLIQDGSTLYGMTQLGGSSDFGTIFSIETNGTGFAVLHNFVGGDGDGQVPYGSLIQDGNTLFGMTSGGGGDSDIGTIFSIGTNGTGYVLLHNFVGGVADGKHPEGSLIQDGSTLYGMTSTGGSSFVGTIFSIGTNGTEFALLHNFVGSDGDGPVGSLIQDGSTLYGMTCWGGSSGVGEIFKFTDSALKVEKLTTLIEDFIVLPAYPNPFNPSTTITYGLDYDSKVSIQIYDITGQLVTTLFNAHQQQGWHSIQWSGTDYYKNQVPAGIYFGKISSNNTTKTTKLMLLK